MNKNFGPIAMLITFILALAAFVAARILWLKLASFEIDIVDGGTLLVVSLGAGIALLVTSYQLWQRVDDDESEGE